MHKLQSMCCIIMHATLCLAAHHTKQQSDDASAATSTVNATTQAVHLCFSKAALHAAGKQHTLLMEMAPHM